MSAERYIELLKRSLLGEVPPSSLAKHERGHYMGAVTMIGRERLDNIHDSIMSVLERKIPGHFIEAGVWKGGASIFMRGMLAALEVHDRSVFVADSFSGLPWPDDEHYPQDKGDNHCNDPSLSVSETDVRRNFESYGLLDEQVIFVKGWFKDTLPNLPDVPFAMIRLDGDMYGSTMESLNALYPKLSVGGVCIIDDYALVACQKAVADYRAAHGINDFMVRIDWTGMYWVKTT